MPFFKKSNKRRRVRKNRKTRRQKAGLYQRAGWGGLSYPVQKKNFSLQGGGWGGPVINSI